MEASRNSTRFSKLSEGWGYKVATSIDIPTFKIGATAYRANMVTAPMDTHTFKIGAAALDMAEFP